jgi:hypothetical protein
MTTAVSFAVPSVDGVSIELPAPHSLKLKGIIAKMEPSAELATFFRKLHSNAIEESVAELRVDVSQLTFVNSSAIRLFIDWAAWVKNAGACRYVLCFRTSRHVTWQSTAFSALRGLMGDIVHVELVD